MVDQKKLRNLRRLITEGLRVQIGSEAVPYVDVGHAMQDVSAKQNHTVFARRGCGKTLLLHESRKALGDEIRAIYLNCEDFKQHTFPNVLIEILASLFTEMDSQLTGWFGKKRETKQIIRAIRERLKAMHQSPDVHEESIKHTKGGETSVSANGSLAPDQIKIGLAASKKTKEETERTFKSHKQKLQELDLWLPELKKSLREFFAVSSM